MAMRASHREDLSLEGYVVTGFGCNVMGTFEPEWLAHPVRKQGVHQPAPLGTIDRPTFLHYPAPGVTNPPLSYRASDPAAEVAGCRLQFVVTGVTALP
jgi:hypothetical protein